MKVTMKQHISGTRNGEQWPDVGETIDLPDDEADAMVAQGYAEKAGKSSGEKKTATPKGEKADEG